MKKQNLTKGNIRTAICVLVLCIYTLCSYAAKDIIVDHDKKTITIMANFVTYAPIKLTLYDAAALWNAQSGKYKYKIMSGDSTCFYTVNFIILVNEDPTTDVAMNIVTVIPDDSKLCKARKRADYESCYEVYDKPAGITDRKVIAINEYYKKNQYVLAHEIGHNLGLTHSEGLMHSRTGSRCITIFNIKESLAQLQGTYTGNKNTLRKRVELGTIPEKVRYVSLMLNDDMALVS